MMDATPPRRTQRRAQGHPRGDRASALLSPQRAEDFGLGNQAHIVSSKVSGVQHLVGVYTELGERCRYALHLGLTEAGMGSKGIVASTAGMGILLQQGMGTRSASR